MGLTSALILTIVSLSGTICIFKTEIIQLLNHDHFKIMVQSSSLGIEKIIQQLEEKTGNKVASFSIPASTDEAWTFQINSPGKRHGEKYLVNPGSGQATAYKELKGVMFFSTMIRLHRWLLMDKNIGRPIVGTASVIMSLLIISGIFIWLPNKLRYWKKGLRFRFTKNRKKLVYELHKSLGFYAVLIILIMSITGPYWSFKWYREGVYSVLSIPLHKNPIAKKNTKTSIPDQSKASVNKTWQDSLPLFLEKTDHLFPYKGTCKINIPDENDHSILIQKTKKGFIAMPGYDSALIDINTGKLIKSSHFLDQPLNQIIIQSFRALHTGSIFGLFSKILYFIAALIASSLPLTGFLIWRNRNRKKRRPEPMQHRISRTHKQSISTKRATINNYHNQLF